MFQKVTDIFKGGKSHRNIKNNIIPLPRLEFKNNQTKQKRNEFYRFQYSRCFLCTVKHRKKCIQIGGYNTADKSENYKNVIFSVSGICTECGKQKRSRKAYKYIFYIVRHSFSSLLCATAIRIRAGFIINMSTK